MVTIRKFQKEDREALEEITALCFREVSIDANIEEMLGLIHGHDWRWRKKRHIDADIAANPEGIFVAVERDRPVGYITTVLDREAGIGRIPNLAVLAEFRGQGLGRRLIETALGYMREQGMEAVRIETLAQNEIGRGFYPKLGFREVARQIHYVMSLRPE